MIDKILDLMSTNNINAHTLEKNLGLSGSLIYQWKNGKSKPSAEALAKIADYFDVTVDYLMGRPEKDPTFLHYRTAYKNKILVFDNSGDKYEFDFDKDQLRQVLDICKALTNK